MASLVRAAFILTCLAAATVRAGDICPAPPKYTSSRPADIAIDDHRIYIDSDDALLGADGNAIVNGRVRVRQDERSIAGDSVTYDYNQDLLNRQRVGGLSSIRDCACSSMTGRYDPTAGVDFSQASFQLMDRNGRGVAKDIDVSPDGKVSLNQVLYTSCPIGKDDWVLKASSNRPGYQDAGGRRAQRHHALQGRADFLHALHFLSAGRRTQERRPVSEPRPLRQQRLRTGGALLFQSGAELRPDADARTT